MDAPLIRRAAPADAQVLADLGRVTFVEKFAHLYPPADLQAYFAGTYTAEAFRADLESPSEAMWLAGGADGRPLGYAHAGACKLPHLEVTPQCGELKRIYVRSAAQNLGLGARLLKTALDWLERPGRRLWLGVWSENLDAQRFYRRHGFERVGEYKFPVGQTLDDEFILRRG